MFMGPASVEQQCYGRVARRKPLISKKNIAALLLFGQGNVEGYWKTVLWTNETEVEPSGSTEKSEDEQTLHYSIRPFPICETWW